MQEKVTRKFIERILIDNKVRHICVKSELVIDYIKENGVTTVAHCTVNELN